MLRDKATHLPAFRRLKEANGFTYPELSARTGFTRVSLQSLARMQSRCPARKAIVLAEVLGVTVEELEEK